MANPNRLTLDPTYCRMLVKVFHQYPTLWDRSEIHKPDMKKKQKQLAVKDIKELEKRLLLENRLKAGRPLFKLNMDDYESPEEQYEEYLDRKWSAFLDHFNILLKKVQEQKDLARQHATGLRVNPMTAVCGRWSDWEETYNDWLKHAVSGHSGGQALAMDTEAAPVRRRKITGHPNGPAPRRLRVTTPPQNPTSSGQSEAPAKRRKPTGKGPAPKIQLTSTPKSREEVPSIVKDKLDFLHIKTFTLANIDKLVKSLQEDLDLYIDEKKDKTNRKLLISTICELITALKKIKGGRSDDGQSGSLTKLDEDVKKIIWNFFTAKDDKQPGEDSVDGGEQLATTVNEASIRVSNIFERCNIGAIQTVTKKMPPVPVTKPGSSSAPESEQSAVQRIALAIRSEPRAPVAKPPVQPDTTPAAGPAPPTTPAAGPAPPATAAAGPAPPTTPAAGPAPPTTPAAGPAPSTTAAAGPAPPTTPAVRPAPSTTPAAGPAPPPAAGPLTSKVRKDHISRVQKESASRLKRRNLHPKGLRDTSATMVEEALKIDPVIAVAEQARQILQEDRWDVFGKGIAELSAVACQDELELIEFAGKILLKIAADAKAANFIDLTRDSS